ncbi:hypothetical protein GCM10011507_33440 [Edaphobacter acidisoli]|uniref:CARDB domain-containing protein n=1 Tax=Edaphobacter acidisoli TaxID=2040573 RepID=A0A916S0W7_9BACT|nr:hypothetical protein [Edaphobacter acidisoli]GGA79517.1 hypothetical protein GCM10011507_33440 [Edaphobacter acidisoli]
MRIVRNISGLAALCLLFLWLLTRSVFASVSYPHVQTTGTVAASPISRYVTLTVHLRNIGGIATACVVKASGQKRVTGISADGEAEVTFAALKDYHGYTVHCEVN